MRRKFKISFKEILLVFILLILIFPAFQQATGLIRVEWLKGSIDAVESDSLTLKSWLSGDYQDQNEKYQNDNFGFRNAFIRLNNEISFDFFKKALANGVIIGKENYLFEENYIKAYYGTDFIGKDSIEHRMKRLKFVQDTLSKLNKDLVLIFAAGKGTYYSEFFPDEFVTKKGITNYEYHLKWAKSLHINYIDFNSYFLKNKKTTKYPLYPQYGIHWSKYGMCLAADSIIHFIEKKRSIDMNTIYWDQVDMENPKEEDYDIADGMNLIFKLGSFKMGYPQLKFENSPQKIKPNLLVISDSYYWGMYNFGLSQVFDKSHFWYYNKEIYPETFSKPLAPLGVDLKKEINDHDVILLMSTQATLPDLGWGFIERMYQLYKK